MSRPSSIPNP